MEYFIEIIEKDKVMLTLNNNDVKNISYYYTPLTLDNLTNNNILNVDIEIRYIDDDNNRNEKFSYFKKWLIERNNKKDVLIKFSTDKLILKDLNLYELKQVFNEKEPGSYYIKLKNNFSIGGIK